MNSYLIVLFGWIIGQVTFTIVGAWFLQRTKQNIDWGTSIKVYAKAEQGGYYIAVCALVILMFIISDYVDPHLDRKLLLAKTNLTWQEKAIVYGRTFSVVFGIFCQFLLLVAFKRGIKAINDYDKKNGTTDIKPQ